jgi:hypothetical protein
MERKKEKMIREKDKEKEGSRRERKWSQRWREGK